MEQDNTQNNIVNYILQNEAYLRRLIHANIDSRILQYMDIDDVLQELYLVVFRNINFMYSNPQMSYKLKFRHLLMELFGKLSRKYLRPKKQGRIKTLNSVQYHNQFHYNYFEELVDSITSPSQSMIRQDNQEIIKIIWDELSEIDKQILFHRYFEQLDNIECAMLLQLSESAVANRHQRALIHVKEKLLNYSETFKLKGE